MSRSTPGIRRTRDPFTRTEIASYYKDRAPKVRQRGTEWRGPCPLHYGESDAFAIDSNTGAWHCHSKCGHGGSLFDFEMAIAGTAFREAAAEVDRLVGRAASSGSEIVAEYDYTDEASVRLFQCVRYQPKTFKQRRPNGRGGWIWNLKGVRRVLFRLPRVKGAHTVIIVEGEKDVLSLEALGFVATCNPMGAGKWRPEYSDQLAGKHVVILPDNDQAGKKHATNVAHSLHGKATSVRIGNVPVGKDVTDWINSGAGPEEIGQALETAELFALREPIEPSPRNWEEELVMGVNGSPRPILANAITALRHAPEWTGVIAFDEFSQSVVALASAPWGPVSQWTDQEDRLTANWLQRQGILVSVDIAGQAVQVVAHEHLIHPVRNYLDRLSWDGVERLDRWLCDYLGVEEGTYSAAVGTRWLISAVARAYKPGVKADCCLILEGNQGSRKSTAIRALAGNWYTDEIAELGSKDAALQTQGVWIIEIAELDGMSKAEVCKIKAFMSRSADRFRPPYSKRPIESPRQCVFAGSVNHSSYLRDETGGRRFWPVRCGEIKIDELSGDRDQLWAEARERYLAGDPWWLDERQLDELARIEQADRLEEDPWQEMLGNWLVDRADTSVNEILQHCIQKPMSQWTQQDKNRISRCLQALGWERYRVSTGPRYWRYRSGGSAVPVRPSLPSQFDSLQIAAAKDMSQCPSSNNGRAYEAPII